MIQNVKKQLTAACRCAYSRLALNVYMFGEILADEAAGAEETVQKDKAALEREFLRLMSLFLAGEPVVEDLGCLRERVRGRMELATVYADRFQIYEHVFNRLEGRFGMGEPLQYPDLDNDEKRLLWLMEYITASDERATVNQRIQNVLGQLPVRLTRQKFFSMVREALNLFKGAEGRNLDAMMYVLRSEALLNRPMETADFTAGLEERLERFRQADYKNMGVESFREQSLCLEQTADMLAGVADRTSLLMDLINDLYVLALAEGCEVSPIPEEHIARQVLASVPESLRSGKALDAALLEPLEGSQEACFAEWETWAAPLDLLEEQCAQDETAELLRKIRLLLSTSSFMSLEREEQELRTVDAAELDRVCGEFAAELGASWEGQPRLVVRAVMAQILSSLPIFFGSLEEVERYIRGCLDSCADETEKAVSVNLIRQMWELEDLDLI